jgi:hypothetical protein
VGGRRRRSSRCCARFVPESLKTRGR